MRAHVARSLRRTLLWFGLFTATVVLLSSGLPDWAVVWLGGAVLTAPFIAPWVRDRLAGQTLTLDEVSEDITYEIPLIPPSLRAVDEPVPYTFTDAGVALAWSQAAAGLDGDADEAEPRVDRFVFDADRYYGWSDR